MPDFDPSEEATLFPKTAGERLRESRESQGISLAEVAARTRVPLRHLEAIEQSNYGGLPSHTYSVGFAKAYARAIGMDEVPIARDVRAQADAVQRPPEYQPYEMQDIKRQPPKGLALGVSIAAVLVVIAVGLWYGTTLFRGDGETAAVAPAVETMPAPVAPTPEPVSVPSGQVTLTATDVVWLRIYDGDGKSLYEAEMKPGERYDVPADANRPMINVGRPDKLQVSVNGSNVPALGDGARAIKDVEISAQALLARGTDATAMMPAATATDTPAATAAGSPSTTTRRSPRRPARNVSDRTAPSTSAEQAPPPPVTTPAPAPTTSPPAGGTSPAP